MTLICFGIVSKLWYVSNVHETHTSLNTMRTYPLL